MERAHAVGALWMQQVMTAEQARRADELGADVIIAQGTEAGGHSGGVSTMVLVPQVLDIAGTIPVVAAGAEDTMHTDALDPIMPPYNMARPWHAKERVLRAPFAAKWDGCADELADLAGELGPELIDDILPAAEIVCRIVVDSHNALGRVRETATA